MGTLTMDAGQIVAGKYRLDRPLGAGGMASVWAATNVFTERAFAIKFMLPEVARTPEAARRFLLEAKVSGRIRHPNVVEMIDVGQAEDGSLFLVMELLSGMSLDVAVRRREPPMGVREFLLVMRDIAAALAEVHGRGIVHRDLKPTNIFLHRDRDGRVVAKLLDFGVSKVLQDDSAEGALTVVGTILGSPYYMSPEQAMGAEGIDGRTDIFAFGSILFEALCGQRAYDAPTLQALIVALMTTAPRDIDALAPQLPASLRALVRGCMSRDKASRIASFQEVALRLDAALLDVGTDLPLARPPPDVGASGDAGGFSAPRPRISDRPPAGGADVGGSSPPISIPMSAPIFVPQRPLALDAPFAGMTRGRPALSSALVVVAGVAAIVAVAGFVRRGPSTHGIGMGALVRNASDPQAAGGTQSPVPPLPEPASNVPTVSVNALPVATHAAHTKAAGRLSISAAPGSCVVSVDGLARGTTPLRGLEVGAGTHDVECVGPTGKAKTASLSVADGGDAHYYFSVPE